MIIRPLAAITAVAALLSGAVVTLATDAASARMPSRAEIAPPARLETIQNRKNCRREPIWGFRISAFCKPSGICNDRVIKGYRTVCT